MLSLSHRLAWRYIKTRKSEGFVSLTTWFAIVGIALGVATIILVSSLMNGVRSEMRDRFLGIDGHVIISTYGEPYRTYLEHVELIEGQEGVLSASPKIVGQVMATAYGRALGAQVIAMPEASLKQRPMIYEHIRLGKEPLRKGLLLGYRLAHALGLRVGDHVTLLSPEGRSTAFGFIPRMKRYQVTGLLDFGMHLYDSGLIIMPFEKAQSFFKMTSDKGSAVSELEVMLANAEHADAFAKYSENILPSGMRAVSWSQNNQTVFAALAVQRNVMVLILALIVLVAVFNIISTQMMLVQQKASDIAILRTMGASRRFIRRIFLVNGAIIGSVGAFSGLAFGLLLAKNLDAIRTALEASMGFTTLPENIYFLSSLPTKTEPFEVLLTVLFAIGLSLAASLYPAARAARISPAEVLRHG